MKNWIYFDISKDGSEIVNTFLYIFQSLPLTALQCFCDLLVNIPHFNFRTNIMAVLVPMMNDHSAQDEVSCVKNNHPRIFRGLSIAESLSWAVTKALILGGGAFSYIFAICPTNVF